MAVSKKHPLAAVERPSIEALQGVRQIVVNARDSESESPITVSPDVWEVDGAQWASGLPPEAWAGRSCPRAVAMTQPGLRSSLALLSAPFDLPPERLILRTKKDEVPPVFAKWWAAALRKTARRLGPRSARINVTISARLCDGRSEKRARESGLSPSFLQENARFGHVFDTMTLKTG